MIAFCFEPFFFADSHKDKARYYRAGAILLVILFICMLATLVNPYGFKLHQSILALMDSDFFNRLNTEWKSPDFMESSGILFQALFGIIVVSSYLSFRNSQRLKLFEFLSLSAFVILYLRSVRLLPFLSIVLAVPLSIALKNFATLYLFEWMPGLNRIKSAFKRIELRESRSSKGVIGLLVVSFFLIFFNVRGVIPGGAAELGPARDRYPYQAIEYLNQSLEKSDKKAIVYATPNWGGFITFFSAGKVQPYLDDRNTMLGEQVYKEYLAIAALKEVDWLEKIRKTRATHLVVKLESALNYGASCEGLERVYVDKKYAVYVVQ